MHCRNFSFYSLILGFLLFSSCSQTVSKVWLFEWKLLNGNDSTAFAGDYSYRITVNQEDNAADITEDSLLDNGTLIFQIITVGDKEYIDRFPQTAKFNLELKSDTVLVVDTIIQMTNLTFENGYSIIYKQNMQSINYDTIFVLYSNN